MTVQFDDVRVEGHDYRIDLAKLIGKKIARVEGNLSLEFGGDPTFLLDAIVFEDGTRMACEGEHDAPYVTAFGLEELPNWDDETLMALYDEINVRNGWDE